MNNEYLIVDVRLDLIDDNPFQTRMQVPHEHIGNLASDIRANGLKQKPQGRPVNDDGQLIPFKPGCRIQLAFGHNRHKSYYLLNGMYEGEYETLPIEIVDYNDEQMAITAWSENETRKQLNPVERATAIQKMMETFQWTHQQVAEKIRMERSTVTNLLRLLKLPENLLANLAEGVITQRQAMALLPFFVDLTTDEQDGLLLSADFSEFMELARNGQIDSDTIRTRVGDAIAILHPAPAQFEFAPDESPSIPLQEGEQSGEAWLQKDIEGNDVPPVIVSEPGVEEADEGEEPEFQAIPENHPTLPIVEQTVTMTAPEQVVANQPVIAAPPAANGAAVQAHPNPSPSGNPPAGEGQKVAPKSWPESTYTVTLGFQAEDGHEHGRQVYISARRDEGSPAFLVMRQKAFNLPWQIEKMIMDLHPDTTDPEQDTSTPASETDAVQASSELETEQELEA